MLVILYHNLDKQSIKPYSCVHLDSLNSSSDHAMHRAFAPLLPDFEILLVSRQAGICWHQNKMIDPGLIQDVIEITEKRKDRENE